MASTQRHPPGLTYAGAGTATVANPFPFPVSGQKSALLHITSSASGVGVVQGSLLSHPTSDSWVGAPTYIVRSTGVTPVLAGASITLADGDQIAVAAGAYTWIRFKPSAGAPQIYAQTSEASVDELVGGGAGASTSRPINNKGNTYKTTVAGNACTKIPTTDTDGRLGVFVHNPDASLDLWLETVATGAAAPTMTVNTKEFLIPPKGWYFLALGSGLDLYGQNSSGAATTSNVTLWEGLV